MDNSFHFKLSKDGIEMLFCILLVLILLFNVIIPLDTVLSMGGDYGQMVWNLWVVDYLICQGENPFITDLVHYPEGANLTHHSLASGFFPLVFIVKNIIRLINGQEAIAPLISYHLIIWLSFALILIFSYKTLRELNLSKLNSLIPAIGYTFCAFYQLHWFHLNLISGFFIPLTAWLIIRFFKRPTTQNACFVSFFLAISIYFTEFIVYILMAIGFLFIVSYSLTKERKKINATIKKAGFSSISISVLLFCVIIIPFVYYWFLEPAGKMPEQEISRFSANLAGFFIPHPDFTPLYGNIFSSLNNNITAGISGFEIFIGFPLLLSALLWVFSSKNTMSKIAAVTMTAFFILSLGPSLKIMGWETGIPLPYKLIMHIPPFSASRTPVRFVVIAMFFLSILAGFGLSWLDRLLKARIKRNVSWIFKGLLLAWVLTEVFRPYPTLTPIKVPENLNKEIPGPVLNMPLQIVDGHAALLQTFHHKPIIAGYTARITKKQLSQFDALSYVLQHGLKEFQAAIHDLGIKTIIIRNRAVPHEIVASYACDINIIDLRD